MATAAENIATLQGNVVNLENSANLAWTIFGTALVFWMHAGFSMLEAGSIRLKNVRNILFKNMLNVLITTLVWWFWGYAFAYGTDKTSGFIGGSTQTGYLGLNLSGGVDQERSK